MVREAIWAVCAWGAFNYDRSQVPKLGIQSENLSSRLLSWILRTEEYDFTLRYLSGKTMPHADFLFCIHKSKSIDGDRGEESVSHKQADMDSDENEFQTLDSRYEPLRVRNMWVWKTDDYKGMLWLAYRQSHWDFQNLCKAKILRKLT